MCLECTMQWTVPLPLTQSHLQMNASAQHASLFCTSTSGQIMSVCKIQNKLVRLKMPQKVECLGTNNSIDLYTLTNFWKCFDKIWMGGTRKYTETIWITSNQSSWSKGISETRSKRQNPCSKCMHHPCDITGQKIMFRKNRPVMSHC